MMEKANLPPTLWEGIPWQKNGDVIWLFSHFLLRRNLSKFVFPEKMTLAQATQASEWMQQSLVHSAPDLNTPVYCKADQLNPLEREFLSEHFLIPNTLHNPSEGQAVVLDNTAQFLATLNVEDHVHLHLLDTKESWEKSWDALSKLDTDLSNQVGFAFSPKFGYLTSNPVYCGTGLTISCYLHLPALIHTGQFQDALRKQKEEVAIATSIQGVPDSFLGDLVVLTNRYTLGLTEENILHSLHNTAIKLTILEKTLRTHLQDTQDAHIKDKISRSYGLLMHSYQLEIQEALDALSLIKLGLDLGMVTGISDYKVNELLFKCSRAHLMNTFKGLTLNGSEIAHKRAEFLHNQIKSMNLTIPA